MPDITNVQAVAFCNDKVRIFADSLATALHTARSIKEFADANPAIKTAAIADGTVIDKSAEDGRQVITGNDVLGILYRADELWTAFGADAGKYASVLKVATNGPARF